MLTLQRFPFLFAPLALAALIVAWRTRSGRLSALYLVGGALCLLNMLVGVGGGVFHNGDLLPFLSLPVLSGWVAANFALVSRWLAALTAAVFVWAFWIYWTDAFIPWSLNQPNANAVRSEPNALLLVTQVTWEIE